MNALRIVAKLAKACANLEASIEVKHRQVRELEKDRDGDKRVLLELREQLNDAGDQLGKMAQAGQVLIGLGYAFENGKWVAPVAAKEPVYPDAALAVAEQKVERERPVELPYGEAVGQDACAKANPK